MKYLTFLDKLFGFEKKAEKMHAVINDVTKEALQAQHHAEKVRRETQAAYFRIGVSMGRIQ